MFNSLKKVALGVSAFFTSLCISIHAQAASLLPTGALDTVGTDAIDTVKDITTEMLPWVVGIATAWSVVTFVKKGFGKAGVK